MPGFTLDQVNWYRSQSAAYTERNGGKPLPALAFFHIPLPEYNQAAADESAILIGTRMEKACAPLLNTGMFAAMKEAGDVMGTFVGHDHDNDYSVMWHGILLAYGRFTGGNTEYNHLPEWCPCYSDERKRPHIHYLDSYQRRGDCRQNGLSGQLPERRLA